MWKIFWWDSARSYILNVYFFQFDSYIIVKFHLIIVNSQVPFQYFYDYFVIILIVIPDPYFFKVKFYFL